MRTKAALSRQLILFVLCVFSSACGGNDSPPTGGAPTQSPAPAPTPTPAATIAPLLGLTTATLGKLGQTAPQQFAVLAVSMRGRDGGFGYNPDLSTLNLEPGVGMRLAAGDRLAMSLPTLGEDLLVANGGSGTGSQGLFMLMYSVLGGGISITMPSRTDGTLLKSTAQASWVGAFEPAQSNPYLLVDFVYGIPTLPANMPRAGAVVYHGVGAKGFVVDFARQTISGELDTSDATAPKFTLKDVVFTGDGTTFKGQLVSADPAKSGELEGRFTGPSGEELMARYVIPALGGSSAAVWTFALAR